MKTIIHRKNATYLSAEEARSLVAQLKRLGVTGCVEHRAVYGYPSHDLAERANLRSILETYSGYAFAYVGSEYVSPEGYKALVIAVKQLPLDFEQRFPQFVVIG